LESFETLIVQLRQKKRQVTKLMKKAEQQGVTHGLRQKNETRDIKYWTYHHDKDHYAIVLISNTTLAELGF